MKTLIATLLLVSAVTLAPARTYYVSGSGFDNAAGTTANPWRTLQKAADSTRTGDSVMVRAGTYAGFVLGWDFDQNGTPADPIVFKADSGAVITSKNNRTADGINLEGASYVVIDGFTIINRSNITRAGIRAVADTGVVLRNNTIDSCGTWGILTGFSEGARIENNTSTRAGSQHGIYFSNSADYPVIRGNRCFDNAACGIHMNGDVSLGGDGVISHALVENNIIAGNGRLGGSGINCDGVAHSVIRNNLLYDNHAGGITLYRIDAGGDAVQDTVINNTVVMASDGRWALNITDSSGGAQVFRNILLHRGSRGAITLNPPAKNGFQSDYNVVKNVMSADGGNAFISLAAWKTQTGQDAHSVTATEAALFVNAAGNDYHLIAGAPAVDLGGNGPLVGADLEGSARPKGQAADAGAYEFNPVGVEAVFPAERFLSPLTISPNPASGWVAFTLAGGGGKPFSADIYNAAGVWIWSGGGNTTAWNAESRPAGVYLVKVSAGKEVYRSKLTVRR